MPSDIINVESYNPAGDGVTDDTAKIQNAFTDAAGGVLLFPDARKRYRITAEVSIPPDTRVLNGARFVVADSLRTAVSAVLDSRPTWCGFRCSHRPARSCR
jgi:hypothetical protein